MKVYEKIDAIHTREEFIDFMNSMIKDKEINLEEWENNNISEYLEAIVSWVEDMDGYYSNMNLEMPKSIDWKFIATLFYVGKIYE